MKAQFHLVAVSVAVAMGGGGVNRGVLPALSKFSPVSPSSNQLHNLTGLMKLNQECASLN